MNTKLLCILAVAVMLGAVFAAGCTTGTVTGQTSCQGTTPVPAVSINETPVRYADVNGVRLAYREVGSGEPLLMIPGFGATMDIEWNSSFLGILASKYHVYTYDNRGMGYSSDDNTTPTMTLYSEDAAGLMTALGYDSMHVYGVSMGSSIAQQLVIDHPGHVRKLVLDSVTYDARIPETAALFSTLQSAAGNQSLPAGIRREAEANLAWNGTWDELSGIDKNVMLVVGTGDTATPQEVAVRMAGRINGSWLVRFRDLPHVGSHYAPVEYGENALDFLCMNESPPYAEG
ncbi:pimeloyl-ACP methyl ester carboxylesterase [Methanolinea mesophila]|uniref:alpha/beta fold hydrolase n=1 Tax=Methanolinea mesophila TaxID=547055 RepID=UPI001AE1A9AD|nr:alpha/beta hydrolase [Methanolinea mesophila]MBP1927794.1 pimeloyl-ACP methyl ester carboxylesterase [Methanolinea mesophila]